MRYDSYLKETLGKRILQNDGFRHFKTLNLPVTAPFSSRLHAGCGTGPARSGSAFKQRVEIGRIQDAHLLADRLNGLLGACEKLRAFSRRTAFR